VSGTEWRSTGREEERTEWSGDEHSGPSEISCEPSADYHILPQEKFYALRQRHNNAILVMEFTNQPQVLLITPTRPVR